MFDLLLVTSAVVTCVQIIKESLEPTIPSENWANKELVNKDILNNVSVEQRIKNARNGKYKLTNIYQEPHRINGKINIENTLLYKEDTRKYGSHQVSEWAKQGKYNLEPEERKKELKRLEEYCKELYKTK